MKKEDFENYFLRDNRGAYINFIDPATPKHPWEHNDDWKYMSVFFGPYVWDRSPPPLNRRPVIDGNGHHFWVSNNFTGSCADFPWENVRNLDFALSVKVEQGTQPYFGQSVISCSCECRSTDKL